MAVCLLALLTLAGCGQHSTEDAAAAGPHHDYERGPLNLYMTTSGDPIATVDTLTLTLAATLEEGYGITFPDYPAPPEAPAVVEGDDATAPPPAPQFTLLSVEDATPALLEDGRVRRERTYFLEPFLEGRYTIPALKIRFGLESDGEDTWKEFETESMSISVASVLAPNAEATLQDIAGPVSVQNPTPWAWYIVGLLLLLTAAGAFYYYRYVRVTPGPPPPPPVPAHILALEALEAIQRDKLVENGLYKEYYIRVSDVLRHYLEAQYGFPASERTTEEFLQELQHSALLGLQEQLLLKEFLRHCDLVKFAKAEPSSEEIQSTFATCKQFIQDTAAAHKQRVAASQEGM